MKRIIDSNFDYKILPKNIKFATDDDLIRRADKVMNDYFYENDNLDLVYMGKGYSDWEYQHTNSANSYQLYIHSLNVLQILTDAYIVTKNKKYLHKANKILKSWELYNIIHCREKRWFAWVDHSASNRMINIMYFYLVACKVIHINYRLIEKMIIEHIDFLDNYAYTKDNHGIILDKTLLIVSFMLKDKDFKEKMFNKGYYRVREAFFRDFSKKQVHLENSSDYHSFTKKLFMEIEEFLNNFNVSLGEEIVYFLENDDYFSYLVRHNQMLPMLGDSNETHDRFVNKKFENFIDVDAGICLFQNKNLYLLFICGYGKEEHKHYDDLSISLQYKGLDIFVDSGKYNNDPKSSIRQYVLSSSAHNSISIGRNYELYPYYDFKRKPEILNYYSNFVYDLVTGINKYENGFHKRTIIFYKPSTIIIHDIIEFKQKETIIQNFNLDFNLKIKTNKHKITITGENNLKVTMEQILNNNFEIVKGKKDIPIGVISKKFAEVIEINQIQTKFVGKKTQFLTKIELENKNVKVKLKDNILTITDDKEIDIYL